MPTPDHLLSKKRLRRCKQNTKGWVWVENGTIHRFCTQYIPSWQYFTYALSYFSILLLVGQMRRKRLFKIFPFQEVERLWERGVLDVKGSGVKVYKKWNLIISKMSLNSETSRETSSNFTNPCISGVWQPKIPSKIQQKSDPRGWGACFPKRELVGKSDRTCYRVQPCGNKSSPHEISKEENDQVYFIKLADRR